MAEQQAVLSYDDLLAKTDAFDDAIKGIDKLEGRLKDFAKSLRQQQLNPNDLKGIVELINQTMALEKAQKSLNQQRTKAVNARKQLKDLTDEELIQREKERAANRERIKIAKLQAVITNQQAGDIKRLRAELSLVSIQWANLTDREGKNAQQAKELSARKLQLTTTLENLERATGDARRGVGKYELALKGLKIVAGKSSSSLTGLGRIATRLFIGRALVDGIRRVGGALVDIVNNGADASKELADIQKSGNRLVNTLTGAGAKLLQFFAPTIQKVINRFNFIIEKINQVSQSAGFLGTVFRGIGNAISSVIDFLFDLPAVYSGIISAGRQLAFNISATFQKLSLELQIVFERIALSNPFSDRNAEEIERNIARLRRQVQQISNDQVGVVDAYKEGFEAFKKEEEEFSKRQGELEKLGAKIRSNNEATTKQLEEQNRLIERQNDLTRQRLEAIESLQQELIQVEAANIKDRQERLFRLEELRFKEEQKQREANFDKLVALIEQQEQVLIKRFGENSKQVVEFRKQAGEQILNAEQINYQLEQEQLIASEKKKQEIRKEFALSTQSVASLTLVSEQDGDLFEQELKRTQDAVNADQEKRLENTAKQKEAIKSLLNETVDFTEQLNQRLGEFFQKQVEFTTSAVERQSSAVVRAEERARQGLSNTLKFEQEQLAASQAAQARAERQRQQQEKISALFSLVAAKAKEGDPNATLKAIAEIATLEALSGAIQGSFYEGTEDTGISANPIDNRGGMLAVIHPHERIMTRAQNQQLADMSNSDVVEYAILGKTLAHNADAISTKGAHMPDLSGLEKGVQLLRRDFRQIAQRPTIMDHQEAIRNGIEHRVKATITAGMKKREKYTKGL
ncbi:hypothetical protein [Gilvibacter sp.]|uniref:hypothetical protein n=1 Tax=Gilvibacter sp. TaxID=2729997 RepID=UPI0025C6FC0D|nr:hypothetical protein [Gilvibacter sp.]NQX77294.1 hypothetical protein [Gilvibacter sp.]